ncbi:type II secretion system protein GspD [Xanthomarina gelatinilytica]|uniref:type II secretion system protein GspD n=1 Tax=Xanthomarina gelatinilytica TaxID=1137281 RepID=UPI003AA7EF9D
MHLKKFLFLLIFLNTALVFSQKQDPRFEQIRNQLTALSVENGGLTEHVKTDITVNNMTLAKFLLAISEIHEININVDPQLHQVTIANNFKNVPVADVLVWLCKEYNLTIDFTGNILSIQTYRPPAPEIKEKEIYVAFDPPSNLISLDLKGDKLYDVFKTIMDKTGKNLVFSPGLESKLLTAYMLQTPFDIAMGKLAYANNLYYEKTKDNFYLFESNLNPDIASNTNQNTQQNPIRPTRRRNSNIYFKVLDPITKVVEVDFQNAPIADIIGDIGTALDINVFTASPLDEAGTATFKAKSIPFDDLLVKIFEMQSVSTTQQNQSLGQRPDQNLSPSNIGTFSFKKEDDIYFFGTEEQLSVRKVEIIYMRHRSVSLLGDASNSFGNNTGGSNFNSSGNNSFNSNSFNQFDNLNSRNQNTSNNQSTYNNNSNENNTLIDIVPIEIVQELDIQVDYELNCFYVNGTSTNIERLKEFLNNIDKPVPVILIEVMFIEVNQNMNLEAGVSWGIGENPTTTQGSIYPTTDMNLGADAVNSILSGFSTFSGFNLGKVVPNFFASIKLAESNGNLKIRSTPKLATLNGHKAMFSNGQTSYYAVTQRNIYGTDNPQTSEITNYFPIEAQLGLIIRPSVSGDGQVLLDINVIQSAFGSRIAEDAPPNINSRTFSSIIRMEDQDIAILGGLEEQSQNKSSTGVPLLARVPVIKWLFSKQTREGFKSKLTVLIKPTVIY